MLELKDKLLSRITKIDNGCWEWQKTLNNKGYGQIRYKRKLYLAHRVSFEIFKEDPKNFLVLHRCDNPKCINPEHLFLGTYKDNTQDMIEKERDNFGNGEYAYEKGHIPFNRSKTPEEINDIKDYIKRHPNKTMRQVSIDLNVSYYLLIDMRRKKNPSYKSI